MKKIACFILSYEITKGMKSLGPKGLLRSRRSKELVNCQISNIMDTQIDINLVLGFGNEKIKKRIEYNNVTIIDNDLYETTNQGYALELIINNFDVSKYHGCLIINNGILFNSSVKQNILKDTNRSKIFYINKKENKKTNFSIGCSINDSCIEHLFFNLTNNLWNEILYIDNKSFEIYKNIYKQSMRNMFLFELVNKSIDQGVKYFPVRLKTNDIIKIINNKDSEKIKEKI